MLAAVSPNEVLQARDRLVFVGVVESVVDLQRIPGLNPATDQVFELDSPRSERCLIEAVVSNTCPLVNLTVREARFRTRYNAAVIALARNGQRMRGKIGDMALLPGDTLLLEAHSSFADLQRNSRDFYLVSRIEDSTPRRPEKTRIALATMVGMVVLVAVFNVPMLLAALLAAGVMLVSGCVRGAEARRSVDWSIYVTMGAGLGIGEAMKSSGTDEFLAVHLIGLSRQPTDPEVAARRMNAATAWISTAFAVAREIGSAGVFLATQADPWIVWGLPLLTRQRCDTCLEPRLGLEALYPLLVQESTAFPGQVVLAVGDTHIFRVDKPLYRDDGTLVENFTRVETFGEPSVHWVRVRVDPRERSVFSFHQEMIPGN